MGLLGAYGLFTARVAYQKVQEAKPISRMYCDHAAVYQAAVWVGYDKLAGYDDYFPLYKTVYNTLCTAVMGGLELPPRRIGVWEKGKVGAPLEDCSPAAVQQAIIKLAIFLKDKP